MLPAALAQYRLDGNLWRGDFCYWFLDDDIWEKGGRLVMAKFWVLYKHRHDDSTHPEKEKVVEVDAGDNLVEQLRCAVMPARPGDRSDGLSPQLSSDCIILNWRAI